MHYVACVNAQKYGIAASYVSRFIRDMQDSDANLFYLPRPTCNATDNVMVTVTELRGDHTLFRQLQDNNLFYQANWDLPGLIDRDVEEWRSLWIE
jgi:hypothetical protein